MYECINYTNPELS